MKVQLSPSQARLYRGLALYLSDAGKFSVTPPARAEPVLESIESVPWASLTFAGERHRLVMRLPGDAPAIGPIDGQDVVVPGTIVAVERAASYRTPGGTVVHLDLLAIAAPPPPDRPERRS